MRSARRTVSWLVGGLLAMQSSLGAVPADASPFRGIATPARGSLILTPDVITDERDRSVRVQRGLIFVPETAKSPPPA